MPWVRCRRNITKHPIAHRALTMQIAMASSLRVVVACSFLSHWSTRRLAAPKFMPNSWVTVRHLMATTWSLPQVRVLCGVCSKPWLPSMVTLTTLTRTVLAHRPAIFRSSRPYEKCSAIARLPLPQPSRCRATRSVPPACKKRSIRSS